MEPGGGAGAGIHLQVARNFGVGQHLHWIDVWKASIKIPAHLRSSSLCAELFAAEEATSAAYSFITTGETSIVEGRVFIPDGHKLHCPFDGAVPDPLKTMPMINNLLIGD